MKQMTECDVVEDQQLREMLTQGVVIAETGPRDERLFQHHDAETLRLYQLNSRRDATSNDGIQYMRRVRRFPALSASRHMDYILPMYYILPLTYSASKRKVQSNRD